MRSVMAHQFSQVPKAEIPRSSFDRSHGHKTTFDAGRLVPVYFDEALPGDTFNLKMSAFARLATPIFPIMDNMYLDSHFFAVPMRIIWDNWEKFCGAQDNPGDSTDFTIPQVEDIIPGALGLYAYLGCPPGIEQTVSAMPRRAYNLIWNEWYRDQNMQDSEIINRGNGPDPTGTGGGLKDRGKRHDYFTSCLPWPQKGESVDLPLGTEAPVFAKSSGPTDTYGVFDDFDGDDRRMLPVTDTSIIAGAVPPDALLYANLETATAATVNQLRQAFQVQKLLERDARGGTRYTEVIKAHFGVTSPDARLQRPEYLGGGTTPINITQVAQTSATVDVADGSPQGNLAAYGTAAVDGHGFTKAFTEHCLIFGIVSVRADLTYQQGIDRSMSRLTRYDHFWPVLSHIGEQAVLNKEIFYQNLPEDEEVFGYQERFAEYRYHPSKISGVFRSDHAESLDAWHLSQEFQNLPVLDDIFIEERPPIDRVIAVPSEPHFLFDSYFSLRCARPMPLYGVPGNIDRF